MRVLVCDDAVAVRETLVRALTAFGFGPVDEAGSAEAALDLADRHAVDVIVMDHDLPGMTGAEAVRTLRASGSAVPVVMLTAEHPTPGDPLAELVSAHLVKGLASVSDVLAAVRRAGSASDDRRSREPSRQADTR